VSLNFSRTYVHEVKVKGLTLKAKAKDRKSEQRPKKRIWGEMSSRITKAKDSM